MNKSELVRCAREVAVSINGDEPKEVIGALMLGLVGMISEIPEIDPDATFAQEAGAIIIKGYSDNLMRVGTALMQVRGDFNPKKLAEEASNYLRALNNQARIDCEAALDDPTVIFGEQP